MSIQSPQPNRQAADILVVFGATGDLAHKKIFPALYGMCLRHSLNVPVLGVAASPWTVEQLRAQVAESVQRDIASFPAWPLALKAEYARDIAPRVRAIVDSVPKA